MREGKNQHYSPFCKCLQDLGPSWGKKSPKSGIFFEACCCFLVQIQKFQRRQNFTSRVAENLQIRSWKLQRSVSPLCGIRAQTAVFAEKMAPLNFPAHKSSISIHKIPSFWPRRALFSHEFFCRLSTPQLTRTKGYSISVGLTFWMLNVPIWQAKVPEIPSYKMSWSRRARWYWQLIFTKLNGDLLLCQSRSLWLFSFSSKKNPPIASVYCTSMISKSRQQSIYNVYCTWSTVSDTVWF